LTRSLRAPLLRATLLAGTCFAAFTPLASGAFLWGTGLADAYPDAWWGAWWAYRSYAAVNPVVDFWLWASAIPAAVLPPLLLGSLAWRLRNVRLRPLSPGWFTNRMRAVKRGVTDNHGHSQWLPISDAQKLFPGPDPTHGGIVVGEAYRVDQDRRVAGVRFDPHNPKTWGRGGTAPLLIDPCTSGSGHSLVFAGTGGFKTTSAVSTVLTWTGSSIILDPSTELGPMLDSALRRQHKRVVHIGIPDGGSTRTRQTGFNVLGWIDTAHPEAETHVHSVVSWIYDESAAAMPTTAPGRAEDPFFGKMGRNLVTCLLAHIVWCDPVQVDISLRTFVQAIARPQDEMLDLLTHIRGESNSLMARRLAATLMNCRAEETFSGVFLNAVKGIEWLFTTVYANLVSDGDFDPRALLIGNTTVFLNISLRTLETTPPIARVLVGALLNAVYMAAGRTHGRILFLLDEAARLGRMKALETARDTGRKYGVSLHMLFQSVGQMAEAWGRDGTRAWIDAAAWVGYAAIRAGGAGKDLSEQLGSHGVLAWSEGDNQGRHKPGGLALGSRSRGRNVNVHEIHRSLITAAEMQQDLRDDEIIIVPASGPPIRCSRAIYFRRPEMVAQVTTSRFATSASIGDLNHGRSGITSAFGAAPRQGDQNRAGGGILEPSDPQQSPAARGGTADESDRNPGTETAAAATDAVITPELLAGRSPQAVDIFSVIGQGAEDGRRFISIPPPPPDRAAWRIVRQKISALTEQQAHALITAWVQNGRLSVQTYRDPVNRRDTQGLFVTDPNSPPP
jgi:type IV secretion system protein VirD4